MVNSQYYHHFMQQGSNKMTMLWKGLYFRDSMLNVILFFNNITSSVSGWSVLPVSEQTPNLSTQTGLQQHVHILVILERAIQSGAREAQTS